MSNGTLRWGPGYPEMEELRRDVRAMAEAIVSALLEAFPAGTVVSIYGKGSAFKRWDTPIDYVPEISDIDIHVRVGQTALIDRCLSRPSDALRVQETMERGFLKRRPDHRHTPRPQIIFVNELETRDTYLPSPVETVHVLYGEPYGDTRTVTQEEARASILADSADEQSFLTSFLGRHVFDKPGVHDFQSLRAVNWRVSPVAPKLLVLNGVPFREAWSQNRTGLTAMLESHRLLDEAEHYRTYYLQCWRYFLSGRNDGDACRSALRSAAALLESLARRTEGGPSNRHPVSPGDVRNHAAGRRQDR